MPNRLIHETSPYLQHHADNPVDWYAWGAEALERARREDKPIHLSIGYAACHWCHVMAAETFQDEGTAQLLNEFFVNIKVDREERPDIDRIYQIAQQMLTQRSGGWPLTMFLTHDDQRPFFGGTYFPKEARYGMPAFKDLITRVAQYYREQQSELREQNAALVAALDDLNPAPAAAGLDLTAAPLATCREELARTFDSKFGGFSAAPKFPHPRNIEFLLRRWQSSANAPEPDLQALYMATLTLRRMGEGGINDQLGGGFCRYSVDDYWMIPHFEKMLYDNAELLAVYAQAAVATGDVFYAQVAESTAAWAMREMQDPDGGFYSSLDADSEGHEGKFYVWDADEPRRLLNPAEYAVFAARYGLDREPNFEGRWHLHTYRSLEDTAAAAGLPLSAGPAAASPGSSDSTDEVERLIDSARRKLLAIRSKRIWPARDEKVLTSWNALMIRGLAMAARALRRDDFAAAATSALNFIRASHWRDGRLLATSKEGRAHLNAYLDDYVYLADAILELQQVRFRADELAFARELIEVILARFEDKPAGGFFFTSHDHEQLIHRSKAFSDDATPAGNGIAAFVLQRMGYLLGEPRYLKAAERTLRAAWSALDRYPHAHTSLLSALDEVVAPPEIVILRGPADVIELWRSELMKLYAPRRMMIAIAADTGELPAALAEKKAQGEAVAYVCTGSTCSAPVTSLGALIHELRRESAADS